MSGAPQRPCVSILPKMRNLRLMEENKADTEDGAAARCGQVEAEAWALTTDSLSCQERGSGPGKKHMDSSPYCTAWLFVWGQFLICRALWEIIQRIHTHPRPSFPLEFTYGDVLIQQPVRPASGAEAPWHLQMRLSQNYVSLNSPRSYRDR